jgi:hypothetical protein
LGDIPDFLFFLSKIGGAMKGRKKGRVSPEERRRRVYRERNLNLRAMGFASYKEYLRSDLWRSIRARVLEAHPDCFACGGTATQVHHRTYRKKDLEGRDLRKLFAVCASCHERCEFRDGDGEKLNPVQSTAKLKMARTLRLRREAS